MVKFSLISGELGGGGNQIIRHTTNGIGGLGLGLELGTLSSLLFVNHNIKKITFQ